MNRLIGVLFVTAVACSSVAAPQEDKSSNSSAAPVALTSEPSQEFQTSRDKPSDSFKPTFKFEVTIPPTEALRKKGTRSGQLVLIAPPRYVFKDGALYLDVMGNGILVPVPGGGASGCFDRDLHRRIEKLKTVIEAFPPAPQPTIRRL